MMTAVKNGVVTTATTAMTTGQKSLRARQFHRRRPVTFSFALSRRIHVLDLATKRARAVVPYVMSGRQWLFGDAHIPKRAQESWDRMPHTSRRYSAKHSPCSPISPWYSAKHSPCSLISPWYSAKHSPCSPILPWYSAKHSPKFATVNC